MPIKGMGAATAKYIGTPISNYVTSNKVLSEFAKKITPELSKLYEKINKLPIKGESVDWLKSQVKFDGFIEELGEEVLEDVLNLTIGTDNEERSLENYAKAIFKSPDEWAILAGAVTGRETEVLADRIVAGEFSTASLSMQIWKYDALMRVNESKYRDFILDEIRKRYGAMLDAGSTTVWETERGASDFHNAGSLCHGWSAVPVYVFHRLGVAVPCDGSQKII